MRLTAILCTYNRAPSLSRALESLARQSVSPATEWDVLVVDNNSRDDTAQVVRDFCERYPGRFRYVFEPRQGKSFALNRGIREATADVLAFVDDDVEVDRNWLHALTAPLADQRWAGVGGRILPEKGFVPPEWIDPSVPYAFAPFAFFDLGTEAQELAEPPFGANMAFRTSVFAKHGGFRVDLGPQPGSEIRGEDTEFGWKLMAKGERLWYEPAAIVYHPVPSKRLTKDYFLAWSRGKGRAEVRERHSQHSPGMQVAGIPVVLFRRLGIWTARWLCCLQQARRFALKLKVWGLMGAITESYLSRGEPLRKEMN